MGSGKLIVLKDLISNCLLNKKYDLSYIVELADWSIKWDGRYITTSLNKSGSLKARITTTHLGLRDQIVHFGSIHTFLTKKGFRKTHKSNKAVLTWFHFVPEDKKNKNIIKAREYLHFIHTCSTINKNKLINLGINPTKIVVIPLGVDLSTFKPAHLEERQEIRNQLEIPPDKIVIGSFQKDGVGWGRGLVPKLIKGPDIFAKVVEQLSKDYPIFILLAGPARGYVEAELEKTNVPFRSVGYSRDLKNIAKYYRALDLYLITSRIEGGPKQILEAWASGVPVVSTEVGMVPDIAKDRKDILLAEVENVDQIADKAREIIGDKKLKEKLMAGGLERVRNYSWQNTSKRYYSEIYSKLF